MADDMTSRRKRSLLSTSAWQKARAAALAASDICYLCGERVDRSLSGLDPDGPHVDHIDPRSNGGSLLDPMNLGVCHRKCNLAKGNQPYKRPQSRDW